MAHDWNKAMPTKGGVNFEAIEKDCRTKAIKNARETFVDNRKNVSATAQLALGLGEFNKEMARKFASTLIDLERRIEALESDQARTLKDAGFYREGNHYKKGDGVTCNGSYWFAQEDTSSKPEVGNEHWRLAVRKGRDGKAFTR